MSRLGKKPIAVPAGVTVKVDGSSVSIAGKNGTLVHKIDPLVGVSLANNTLQVTRKAESKRARAMHGLTRALLANHVAGVATPFKKALMIVGVGFTGRLQGKELVLQVGFSHPISHTVPAGLKVDVPNPQRIEIAGIDKQLVGQFAANVRRTRPPEPYKEKGIRYDGERIRKKAGKSLGTGGAK